MSSNDFYKRYDSTQQESDSIHRICNLLSFLRFILFSFTIFFLLLGYFVNGIGYWIAILCLIVFLCMIYFHNQYKKRDIYTQALLKTYARHIKRIEGQWKDFSCTGEEFLDEKDYKSIDLDILGKNSLYQLICTAFTQLGKKKLARLLIEHQTYKDILQRQQAVKELAEHPEFVLKLETLGAMIPSQKSNWIEQWMDYLKSHKITSLSPYIFILPVIVCFSLICVIFHWGMPYSQIILEVGVVLQLCLVFFKYFQHQEMFQPIAYLSLGLESYAHIYAQIVNNSFDSPYLKSLQSCICDKEDAVMAIHQLANLSQKMIYRQNIFAFILLNGLGLFDFYIHYQYAKWLEKYHQLVPKWFDALAKIEALMSLSVLKIDYFDVVLPEIQEEKILSFQDLKHPLIDPKQVVGNDFSMKESLCVITGSNMSGKTTFMRTIALNLVLAYAGGYVFGKQMSCSSMHIMTSMRVRDNVEEGISTFYGELLRIKDMIDFSENKEPMICFIDEIFKGTNSLDRIAGAKATIEKLSLPYAFVFLTTHDLELGQLKNQNYHFDEYYQDEHIYFDYKIKKGPSQSSNGQFLLRQVGILDE